MKIGIFGDSHGDCKYLNWPKEALHIGLGWPEYLAMFYKVKNYAVGGTGLWNAFTKFLENHHMYDLNIFLPSQNSRFSINLPERNRIIHLVPGFTTGDRIRKELIDVTTPNDNIILEAAAGYIDHILDFEKESYTGDLLVKEISNIRPDTIVVSCFDSMSTHLCLSDISMMELEYWNTDIKTLRLRKNLVDYRKCHLTDENNEMVFKKITKCINENIRSLKFTKEDFVPPSKPLEHYIFPVEGRGTNV